jgi:drug/metabolite transporter (DMT)-like permease
MAEKAKIPKPVIAGLFIAVILDTAIQISWKSAVLQVPDTAGIWMTVILTLQQPLFWLVLCMFVAQFLNWMKVLGHADLSYAQPITALSYVTVGFCSVFFLHEKISTAHAWGILLILAGVYFISQTEHSTKDKSQALVMPEANPDDN